MTGALLLAPSSAAGRMRFDPQDLKQGWQREEGRSSLNRGTLSVDFLITSVFYPLLYIKGRSAESARVNSHPVGRVAMKVTVKNWHAVASWTWTTEDDVCGICHMPLDCCAPGAAGPGDDSPVVWGRVRCRSTYPDVAHHALLRCTHAQTYTLPSAVR